MTTLFCLDPGVTTGWCVFDDTELTSAGTLATYDELASMLQGFVSVVAPLEAFLVICEDFTPPRSLPKGSKTTIEWLGIIKFLCHRSHIPLVLQRPQEKLPFRQTAKALLGEGQWTEHSIDAVSHSVRYLRKQNPHVEITSLLSDKKL